MPAPVPPEEEERRRSRFVDAAFKRVASVTLDEVLDFVKVSHVAPGSALSRFYDVFVAGDRDKKVQGRAEMLERVKGEATSERALRRSSTSERPDSLRLANELSAKDPAGGDSLRALARNDFDGYSGGEERRAFWIIRSLMAAVAKSDPKAHARLKAFYAELDRLQAATLEQILVALERVPIPELETTTNLAAIFNAVTDGLTTRAMITSEDEAKTLLDAVSVPLLGALTHPTGSRPPTDRDRLYPKTSATRTFTRTEPGIAPMRLDDLDHLCGTWQGTMWAEQRVLKSPAGGFEPRETYLVISGSGDRLDVVSYVEGGFSRMVLPQFVKVGDALRLVCIYEAEAGSTPGPDSPTHRGAWILEAIGDPLELHASYFNDRATRGQFRFRAYDARRATDFFDARRLFEKWQDDPAPPGTPVWE